MRAVAVMFVLLLVAGDRALAQDEPPRIGPFAFDLRATVPKLPADPQLADSRGVSESDLPTRGLGADAGLHVYLFRLKGIIVGIGGQVTLARAHASAESVGGVETGRDVTERFASLAPQLSFNFGTGTGWSYLSGGLGKATWAIVPNGQSHTSADDEPLTTINYGGGARWFTRPHLAFTFDVRFHRIQPGTPQFGFPGSPRTTILIIGAGMSIK